MTALAARPIGPAGAWHRQLALFAGAYVAYSIGRYAALGDQLVALENARWIVDLEDSVALDLEPSVQRALLDTAWVRLANHVYLAAQFVVVPGALVWLYRHSRAHYRLLRDTVLLAWLISLPIHALFPVAPPRLADVGLIDTISAQTGVALDSRFATSVYNPLAAVPSLHAGFALAISAVAYRAARTTVVLVAAFTWTAAVAVAVVATGNHFVFDIAAGWIVTAASGGLVLLARQAVRRPLRVAPAVPAPAVARDPRRPDVRTAAATDVTLIVNANASGVDSARSTLRDATDGLARAGGRVRVAHATRSLRELAAALEEAGDTRVILVGGDGAVHAAANAGGLGRELALIPAGRANNIARATGIPLDRAAAGRLAIAGRAGPFDVLRVTTAARELMAVEGVSAGFHAAARSRYHGANSADLARGVVALAGAVAAYAPYRVELAVNDGPPYIVDTAQLFVSNLPLFGFGFVVAPSASADDGAADLITLPAPRSRAAVVRELWRVRRGAHLDHAARSRRVLSVEIVSPLPVVADAEVLGFATPTIAIVPAALLLVRPAR